MIPKQIELVRQPTPSSCSHACVAMVTGLDVNDVRAALPEPAGPDHYVQFLCRQQIHVGSPAEKLHYGSVYLLTMASKNLLGKMHLVVLDLRDEQAPKLFDPVDGVEGREPATLDEFMDGRLGWAHGNALTDCGAPA